jgi:hypothetical protein
MTNKLVELLFIEPGGWPRFSKAAFERSPEDEARLAERISKNKTDRPWAVLLLLGLIPGLLSMADGLEFALRFYLLLLLPLICWLPASFVRPRLLQGLPADNACAWPMDLHWDRMRSYIGTVLTVSTYWLMSGTVFLQCVLMMQSGMGDQWNPLTRTIHLTKGGPYSEYAFIEMALFVSGFFAITGLVWWPMIVFFEWLGTRKTMVEQGVRARA